MAIDFPAVNTDPSQPWTNPDTGVTYIYKDGAWRVLSSSDFEDLEDIYVNVSGDNMTGDLTLGTDKITLNATNGNATFAGDIFVNATNDTGVIARFRNNGTSSAPAVVIDGVNRDGEQALSISKSDGQGDAIITNDGQVALGPSVGTGTPANIYLDGRDGSAEFDGIIKSKNSSTSDVQIYPGDSTNNSAFLKVKSSSAQVDASTAIPLSIYDSNPAVNKTVAYIGLNGIASFDGVVGVGNPGSGASADPGAQVNPLGSFAAYKPVRNNGQSDSGLDNFIVFRSAPDSASQRQTVYRVASDGTVNIGGAINTPVQPTIQLNADGTASFAGALTQGNPASVSTIIDDSGVYAKRSNNFSAVIFPHGTIGASGRNLEVYGGLQINTEPDNDDNYTVTTEEYTETESYTGPLGNTLEREVTKTRDVRTYTGPTLDVKERLQNLIARMDAVEANEVIDDATDNSLLLAVAELTSRLNERDALITTLTTRIEALENA